MILKIINFILGSACLKASGAFPERVLNIAKENGIFIQDISRTDERSITFSVSKKGADELLCHDFGPDTTLEKISSSGISYAVSSHKNRWFLFTAPFIIIFMLFLSTQLIWHVNIIGADGKTEKHLLSELAQLGVKKGALKFTIDQSHVKNRLLISNPDLLWIWVDIRGSSAIVKFVPREPVPEIYNEEDFYNIYSTHDAVITKINPTNGISKVKAGDTVLKGQLLIEGSMAKDEEERKFIHASGTVYGLVWEEKTIKINKKNEIRTPTGEKTEHLSVNFENFYIKLFINSRISYPNYDIIENNRILMPFNVTLTKKQYIEVSVAYEDNDISLLSQKEENDFYSHLTNKGYAIDHTESFISDCGDYVLFTMRALCEEPIWAERRMNFGENNSVADN